MIAENVKALPFIFCFCSPESHVLSWVDLMSAVAYHASHIIICCALLLTLHACDNRFSGQQLVSNALWHLIAWTCQMKQSHAAVRVENRSTPSHVQNMQYHERLSWSFIHRGSSSPGDAMGMSHMLLCWTGVQRLMWRCCKLSFGWLQWHGLCLWSDEQWQDPHDFGENFYTAVAAAAELYNVC